MDNAQYMEIFIEESKEHLQDLNQNLLGLEEDSANMDLVNEIFRAAHTLKGMAGTMGFNSTMKLTHGMENILDEVRNGKCQVTSDLIDMLLKGVDLLESLISDVETTGEEEQRDIDSLLNQLRGVSETESEAALKANTEQGNKLTLDQYQQSILRTGMEQGLHPYWIKIELQKSCVLKSARAYIIFQTLEMLGEVIKTNPPAQDIEDEKFDYSFALLILSSADQNKVCQELGAVSEIENIEIQELNGQAIESAMEHHTSPKQQESSNSKNHQGKTNGKGKKTGGSIRVDIGRLDFLMNLVSELIIVKNRIQGISQYQNDKEAIESIEYLTRVTTDLHDAVMKVRMVPIEMVFNRFPRVVRDLARDTGKSVQLNIIGAETEVDRTIVDEIGDPLIHLLRNAIDHGLESPQGRAKAQKNEAGNVELAAYHDGNNVVIEVRDDGKGIDVEKVSKKAVEKGLVEEEKLRSLEDKDIIDFMFHPGFSTAQKVSNISGRGVGLDVVKTKVESLGGMIEVNTQMNRGTRFIIRLPLTLSIIQALLVKVGHELYAVPLNSVQEIMDFTPDDIQQIGKQEVVSYRGKLIPLIYMHRVLNVQEHESQKDDVITAVIIKKGEKLSALSIGSLVGQQEIVIKSLGSYLSNIKIVSGATILGDGSVALILDTNHLV